MNGCSFQHVSWQNLSWFHFKVNRKSIGFSLKRFRDFQNSPSFGRSTFFYVTIGGNFKSFHTLTLKQIFWKKKSFFKKLVHRFLVVSTRIESASFPYKTAIPDTNVKTNRMVSAKWIYHKERSFVSNYFICFKILFKLRISYKKFI